MSYTERIARLAARVAEARRPKRLPAGARPVQPATPSETIAALPAVEAKLDRQPQHTPPSSLPVSGEAARWLIRGEVPEDLVPFLGDPALRAPEPPEPAAVDRSSGQPEQRPRGEGPGAGQVVARIVEGAHVPTTACSNGGPDEDRLPDSDWHSPRSLPSVTVAELPSTRRQEAPLMRLARTPLPQPTSSQDPLPSPPAASAPAVPKDPAQELARRSGGELSYDGTGNGTVTFAPSASPSAPPTDARGADSAPETPSAPALRARLGDLDLDELYEGFLQRLRRDLVHDRERLGDLLGPLP